MLVRDVMQRKVITIGPETTLAEAVRLARTRGVRHLPVLDDGQLVGIVSDRDLKGAMASAETRVETGEVANLLDRLTANEFMTRAVVTIGDMFPVEEAARVMVKDRISALPVTEAGRLVGIVTETDVLDLFVRAMGAGEPSSRLDVVLAGDGNLADVVRAIEEAGTTVSSIMTLRGATGLKEAVIRIPTINPGPAIKGLEARGYSVRDTWPR